MGGGVQPSAVAKMLGVPLDKSGRIKVERDLSVPAVDGVYALGDIALCYDIGGKPLPGLAQVAKQQGTYFGCRFGAEATNRMAPKSLCLS